MPVHGTKELLWVEGRACGKRKNGKEGSWDAAAALVIGLSAVVEGISCTRIRCSGCHLV